MRKRNIKSISYVLYEHQEVNLAKIFSWLF